MVDKAKLAELYQYMVIADAENGVPALRLLGHLVRTFGADVVKSAVEAIAFDQNSQHPNDEVTRETNCPKCGRALRACQFVGSNWTERRIKYCTNLDGQKADQPAPNFWVKYFVSRGRMDLSGDLSNCHYWVEEERKK